MEFVFVNLASSSPTSVSLTALLDTEMSEDNVKNALITALAVKEPRTLVLHVSMDMLWIKLLVSARKLLHANSVSTSHNQTMPALESALKTPSSMKMYA